MGRLPRRRGTGPAAGRARLRRPLLAAHPPDRDQEPQGAQQLAQRRPRRSRKPVGDRPDGRRRPRGDPPRAGQRGGVRLAGAHRQRARHRDRAGLRHPVLGRPPVARRAPRVVQPPARRHAEVRREPAQEVPGHLQRQLGLRGLARPVGGPLRRAHEVGERRRHRLPRRQPAHQADAVLGVADRARPRDQPGRAVPGGGVHAAGEDGHARQGRLQPVLHVLHVEERALGAHGVRRRARVLRRASLLPAELLRQHAGHPHRVPAARRAPGVRGAARARRDAEPDLRHLLGLRELRERAGQAGQRGVPRLREVRGQAPLLRRAAPAAHPARQRAAPRAPRAAVPRHRDVPRQRQRGAGSLRQACVGRPRRRHHQHRHALGAGGRRHPARRARPAAHVRGRRPARRRSLHLAPGPQLRPSRTRQVPPADNRSMTPPGHWFESNPLWFKTAVFYEIHLRGFFDGNGDGSGDFRGLTEKLDYLQWLGIDVIWLLPMYASPLRDGGYDVADYEQVHPDYGSMDDVKAFIEAAHQRGMRVIADLVMNHTSSDHAWFQEARSSPDSPKRDWYVWSDTVHKYEDARIIFTDTETSNWTWDEQARAYFWHRFFSHQPDLNYDNPEVHEAMLDVLRFWLDLGLDGFRLDAVPYLYEREGTNCENLDETHAFLKKVRATIDREYPDRVLLAEANQWPEDVVEYFGEGDECHMAFHFPVMPRMFMAVRREEATPMYEILARTPGIPENCQWGLFLRNHDELTLEMVTDEERDYMYAEYARDPRMKINLGIRRRLAPLLEGGRDEMELMHAILFSLPGSPVLYYG